MRAPPCLHLYTVNIFRLSVYCHGMRNNQVQITGFRASIKYTLHFFYDLGPLLCTTLTKRNNFSPHRTTRVPFHLKTYPNLGRTVYKQWLRAEDLTVTERVVCKQIRAAREGGVVLLWAELWHVALLLNEPCVLSLGGPTNGGQISGRPGQQAAWSRQCRGINRKLV